MSGGLRNRKTGLALLEMIHTSNSPSLAHNTCRFPIDDRELHELLKQKAIEEGG